MVFPKLRLIKLRGKCDFSKAYMRKWLNSKRKYLQCEVGSANINAKQTPLSKVQGRLIFILWSRKMFYKVFSRGKYKTHGHSITLNQCCNVGIPGAVAVNRVWSNLKEPDKEERSISQWLDRARHQRCINMLLPILGRFLYSTQCILCPVVSNLDLPW